MTRKIVWLLLAILFISSIHDATAQDMTFADLPVFQANQQPGNPFVPNDVDGNGVSDVLWFNPVSSQLGYWLMSVSSTGDVTRTALRTINVTPGYYVAATGDFNGDAKVDLVWTSQNHDIYLWASSGAGFQSSLIDTYPAGWSLIGAGDIDGDGKPDILWWDSTTNQFAYWIMRNGRRVGSRIFNISPGYKIVAIGYLGTSNRVSLVWAGVAGDLYDWDSNGGGFDSYYIGSIARRYDAYKIDAIVVGQAGSMAIKTISGTGYEIYRWARQFDSQGVQQSASFTNGAFGGRFPNEHVSGFIFCPKFDGRNQALLFVNTDIDDGFFPGPALVTINGPYQVAGGLNSNDSFVAGFPLGWDVIGATWYQSGQRIYGPVQ